MIYSVTIIDSAGLNLIDRRYVEPSGDEMYDPNLVSGMLTALAQFCEHLTHDKIETITLGNSQFFLLKHQELLFTMHTDLSHSKYLSLVKLQRIRESFEEQYAQSEKTSLISTNEMIYLCYIPILDELLREQSTVELEILIDYFLTGKGIVGTHIRDLQKNIEILSRSPPDLHHRLIEYGKLFELSFNYAEQILKQTTGRPDQYAIFQTGTSWLIGIKQKSLLLVALFQDKLDHNLITDIIHGTLGDVLEFIAEYFQNVFHT